MCSAHVVVGRQFDLVVADGEDSLSPRQKEAIRTHYDPVRERNLDNVRETEWEPKAAASAAFALN